MRIGIFSRYFHHDIKRGIAIYTHELTRALANVIVNNDVYMLDYFFGKSRIKNLPLLENKRFKTRISSCPGRLFDFFNRTFSWPDLGMNNNFFGLVHLLHEYMAPVLRRPNLILTVHSMGPILYPENFEKEYRLKWKEDLDRGIAAAAKVIGVSQSVEGQLRKYRPEFAEKYCSTLLGVPSQYLQDNLIPDEKRVMQKDRFDFPFILYAGAADPGKNLIKLIEAYSLFYRDSKPTPPHHLVVVGNLGWGGYDNVIRMVDNLQLIDQIHFTGYITHEHLSALYRASDLFVFPALFEGFGLPVLEAMASGTPCLVSDRPALNEIGGDVVEYCNPESAEDIADRMTKLLANPDKLDEMRRRVRLRAGRFTWDKTARETIKIYEDVIGLPIS